MPVETPGVSCETQTWADAELLKAEDVQLKLHLVKRGRVLR
jgi:hypothetical protein